MRLPFPFAVFLTITRAGTVAPYILSKEKPDDEYALEEEKLYDPVLRQNDHQYGGQPLLCGSHVARLSTE